MYEPKVLAKTMEPSALDLLYPSGLSFLERHWGLFSSSYSSMLAPDLLEEFKQFIPSPVLKRRCPHTPLPYLLLGTGERS
jgi:hypothetical protein